MMAVNQMEPIQRIHSVEDFSTIKVLLVEDEPTIQKVHCAFLEKIGCKVDIAASGTEAWNLYQNQRYPLLILDGGLPDMTGFELGRRIREHEKATGTPAIPLLLLSGFPYELVKRECELAFINEFAIKPVRPEELQAMVRRWLIKVPIKQSE